jgi:hypothetical protein
VLGFLCGEGIIQADGATHSKAAVGNIMRLSSCPVFNLGVNDQWANVQLFFVWRSSCRIAGDGVWNLLCRTQNNNMRLCGG